MRKIFVFLVILLVCLGMVICCTAKKTIISEETEITNAAIQISIPYISADGTAQIEIKKYALDTSDERLHEIQSVLKGSKYYLYVPRFFRVEESAGNTILMNFCIDEEMYVVTVADDGIVYINGQVYCLDFIGNKKSMGLIEEIEGICMQ